MPQVISNAPATFNRCVTYLLRPVRYFAPSYFDDIFVHSWAVGGKTDVEVHRTHVRRVITLLRKHKLYANLKKCIFAVPGDIKGLRKFLGLAAYLHKYSRDYTEMTVHLSRLLKRTRNSNGTLIVSVTLKVSSID